MSRTKSGAGAFFLWQRLPTASIDATTARGSRTTWMARHRGNNSSNSLRTNTLKGVFSLSQSAARLRSGQEELLDELSKRGVNLVPRAVDGDAAAIQLADD